jgi:hypothetical protein
MKTTGVCLCDSPLRFEHGYCGRCWNRQFATDERAHGQPNPLSASAAPVPTAGAGRPSTPAPADLSPWEADPTDDYVEAYNDAEDARRIADESDSTEKEEPG